MKFWHILFILAGIFLFHPPTQARSLLSENALEVSFSCKAILQNEQTTSEATPHYTAFFNLFTNKGYIRYESGSQVIIYRAYIQDKTADKLSGLAVIDDTKSARDTLKFQPFEFQYNLTTKTLQNPNQKAQCGELS